MVPHEAKEYSLQQGDEKANASFKSQENKPNIFVLYLLTDTEMLVLGLSNLCMIVTACHAISAMDREIGTIQNNC